jgi:hypothetical protein
MRVMAGILGVMLVGAAAQASAETTRFAIMRNGEQIGTHVFEVNRSGSETTVKTKLDLEVKVLFVTAYRLQSTGTERWVDGRLVALKSNTDRNGTRHAVTVTETPSGMQIQADGKSYQAKGDIIPSSLWNAEVLRRSQVLDPQEGEIMPLSVIDHGPAQLTIKSHPVKAHHYTLKSKLTQDVWYDEQQHLVQVKIIGSDGSIIMYHPL